MGLLGYGKSKAPAAPPELIDELRSVVAELTAENQRLREDAAGRTVKLGDYLYRFRGQGLPFLSPDHELRYFMCEGSQLKQWRSSKDAIFNPRETLQLMGCLVEWEGLRNGRYWSWSVQDPSGSLLLRIASLDKTVAERWFKAMLQAGCKEYQRPAVRSSHGHSSIRNASGLSPGKQGMSMRGSLEIPGATAASTLTPTSAQLGPGCIPNPDDPSTTSGEEEGISVSGEASQVSTAKDTADSPRHHHRAPMMGSTPVHTAVRYSYLSSERAWHEKHTGLYNLAGVILIATNFRLALENALKYGWRYNPLHGLRGAISGGGNVALTLCYPALLAMSFMSLALELLAYQLLKQELKLAKQLSKREDLTEQQATARLSQQATLHEWPVRIFAVLNTCAVIGLPWYVIAKTDAPPIAGGLLIMLAMCTWMKLVSYHHAHVDLRAARRMGEVRPGERGSPDTFVTNTADPLRAYPEDLTIRHLAYFLAAPTLVYQVNYPRSRYIRKKWLVRRVAEAIIVATFFTIIVSQYILPTIANSLGPLQEMNLPRVVERVLKLAVPNLYAWLCMFYLVFHLHLNILAELLRFGDREFYKDWWNAPTLGEYWRTWNLPVHKWLLRHVYYPALRSGMNKMSAMVLVFFVSAVFHELALGVPLHMVRLWAFTGIMAQVPLVMISEKIRRKVNRDDWGNTIFWLTFCIVGQPLSAMLYYHDYVQRSARHGARLK